MPDLRFPLTLPGVPRRLLSRCAGALAGIPLPRPARRLLWPRLARRLGIDPDEVPGTWQDYRSFLELFTRPLPAGGRPIPPGTRAWLSPADGLLIDHAPLRPEGTWLIKGAPYSLEELLPGLPLRSLSGYQALQIYLAPRDYHRYHAPCPLRVESAWTGPGDLLPVDPGLARRSLRVLVRNRRVLLSCRDEEERWLGLLFVGALNVGGLRFHFDPTLGRPPLVRGWRRYDPPPRLDAGEEIGWFELGSTVLLFAPPGLALRAAVGGRVRARTPLLSPEGAREH
ncbi:MAG: phosphatidylserine decarboxylase [Planctomycetota bacterium]|nr:MAG: phosphatidylserine decarboxylase [Planctomycetota bacterium]